MRAFAVFKYLYCACPCVHHHHTTHMNAGHEWPNQWIHWNYFGWLFRYPLNGLKCVVRKLQLKLTRPMRQRFMFSTLTNKHLREWNFWCVRGKKNSLLLFCARTMNFFFFLFLTQPHSFGIKRIKQWILFSSNFNGSLKPSYKLVGHCSVNVLGLSFAIKYNFKTLIKWIEKGFVHKHF